MTTSPRRIVGRAQINVNGQFYDSEEGATIKVGGVKNNTRMTKGGFNYNQTIMPAEVTMSIPVSAGVSVVAFQGLADATIVFQSDTGQTWTVANAAQTGEVELKDGADGGFIAVTFSGDPATETLS